VQRPYRVTPSSTALSTKSSGRPKSRDRQGSGDRYSGGGSGSMVAERMAVWVVRGGGGGAATLPDGGLVQTVAAATRSR
jgi:hypothetical protein